MKVLKSQSELNGTHGTQHRQYTASVSVCGEGRNVCCWGTVKSVLEIYDHLSILFISTVVKGTVTFQFYH